MILHEWESLCKVRLYKMGRFSSVGRAPPCRVPQAAQTCSGGRELHHPAGSCSYSLSGGIGPSLNFLYSPPCSLGSRPTDLFVLPTSRAWSHLRLLALVFAVPFCPLLDIHMLGWVIWLMSFLQCHFLRESTLIQPLVFFSSKHLLYSCVVYCLSFSAEI